MRVNARYTDWNTDIYNIKVGTSRTVYMPTRIGAETYTL